MKITMVILYISVIQVLASPTIAQNVNLNVSNKSVREILKTIEAQTHYRFFYNDSFSDLDNLVSIELSNKTVKESLDKLLNSSKISYKVLENNLIVIAPARELMQAKVSGQVISAKDNLPIPGVKVVEKGTSNITVSDAKGNFSLKVSNENATLVFSSIGYTTQEVKLGGQINLVVKMDEDLQKLDEVVVIGYGSTLKSQLGGGSVGTVNVKDLQKAPVISFEDALAGRVAGVQIISSEGGPLSTNNIVIRGNSSVTQNNSPLWVIDGFPQESSYANTIDPSSIKSITVLKDAASTAIYGSRGANGVILITTNQGASGAPVVRFDGYYGFQKTLKLMNMMGPYEYVKLQTELVGLDAKKLYTPGDPTLGDAYVPGGRTLDFYKTAPSIDWQSLLYKEAPMQNYSLSVSGGTDKSNYMVSGSISNQEGTIIETGLKRYQGRFVFNQEINKKTSFNLNVNYANVRTQGTSPATNAGSASSNLLFAVWGYRPAISPSSSLEDQLSQGIDPDGQVQYAYNPILQQQNTTINANNYSLAANSYLDYKIIDDLTLRISGGLSYNQSLSNSYYNINTASGMLGSSMGPHGTISNATSTSLLNENTLTYKKVFNRNHYLNVLVGFSTQKMKANASSSTASNVPNDILGVSGLDEGTPYAIGSSSGLSALSSYFGRVNYNYQSKYYLSIVGRADGSSKFAPGNKWGYFPSGSVAWNVLNEDFMKDINYISELKLRGSYGISGNNRVGDFAYLSSITLPLANNYPFGNVYQKGAVQSALGNTNLKWETTATTDIGFDLGFLKNRIELVADYYKKVTSNLLLQATMPGHIGYTSALENIGKVSNEGLEFALNTINVENKKFSWNSNFNISFNKNRVLALSSGQQALISQVSYTSSPSYPYIAEVGGPISQIIGFKWLGNYQYSDFDKLPNGTYVLKGNVPSNGNTRTTILPGDIKYADINGDGNVTDADKVVIGDPNPLFTGGFSNNFTYKGFDLNVLLTFSYGNDILNMNRWVFEGSQTGWLNMYSSYEDRWTPDNPTNEHARSGGEHGVQEVSSRIVEDGSFLRLKTVSLGYRLPSSFLQKINVTSARVYCSAQNLAVWTKYTGSDPEVSTRPGALTPGFDFSSYPRAFTLVFGFNFTF